MKKLFVVALALLFSLVVPAQKKSKKQKVEPIKPMKEFVDDLMSRMTLEEKIGQLNLQVAGEINTGSAQDTEVGGLIAESKLGGVFNLKGVDKIRALQDIAVKKSRLGIPLIVGMDVIHGYETVFPIPLALSCSWDIDAIEQVARIAAKEASADGINWFFSPMVDISVDPRWGRVAEGAGEDPFLGSAVAQAYVRGYQGDLSQRDQVMACVKHFALYGAVEAGRDYNTVDMSHLRMYNQYFPPYRAAAKAGAGSFMSSFNLVDGQHATANHWLLTDVLRNQWDWNGFVVTDYGSIGEMTSHGFGNLKKNSVSSLKAGTDMDMCAQGFLKTLSESLSDGSVSMADINQACRRVLEAKYKLGLFQDPYRYLDPKRRANDIFTDENRAAARRIAAETFVLLKNGETEDLLPLAPEGKIALIGPMADNRENIVGTWSVAHVAERFMTLREVMEKRLANSSKDGRTAQLLYAQGCNVTRDEALQKAAEFGKPIPRVDDAQAKAEALRVAREADVIVCAMGECADFSGESSSRASLEMPDVQRELLEELTQLGKPIVLLHFSGRPTVLTWEQKNIDAILNVWFAGSETGDAICDVLFGDVVPSGKLTFTFPQIEGQIPLYYNHLPTGRPVPEGIDHYNKFASNYLDVRNDPLYPFGYGLSYTTFKYSDVVVKTSEDGLPTASVTVSNTGKRDADEIVQLYIRDLEASISRPVKELKGFRRIHLKAGESQTIEFSITREQLSYYNAEGQLVFEPGEFLIMTGPNSRDVSSVKMVVGE
ncbi:MAG: beta-glucosidase BglX [Prevotella sp.]|nr:beta-glucosidase BglX [Prevotella sp.]